MEIKTPWTRLVNRRVKPTPQPDLDFFRPPRIKSMSRRRRLIYLDRYGRIYNRSIGVHRHYKIVAGHLV